MAVGRRKFSRGKDGGAATAGGRRQRAEVARAFEINPNLLHRWRKEFRQGPGNAFPGLGSGVGGDRVAELERKIGQQALEIDFLKGCLQRIEEQRMLQAVTGKPQPTDRSKSKSKRAPR